ncbi:MAG: HEAT repeat domain-containing protein [Acidobacteria bacterium]|nr:HEAT repeat domain-containing protein [Acidobacteriota bacterium]
MTRVVLMTVVLAIAPVLSTAQTPPPAPAAPLPMPAPAPAPNAAPAVPRPPLPPMPVVAPVPPMPPMPADVFAFADHPLMVDPIDFHFDFDFSALADIDVNLDGLEATIGDRIAAVAPQIAQVTAQASAQAEAAARAAVQSDLARVRAFEAQLRSGDAYNAGLGALQQRQYERAIQAFDRVIEGKGSRVDAALYWKAFSEFKLARTDAALRTIAQLQKEHAQSRYLNDAKVLEAEARKQSGQRLDPAQLDDDEIKLLAIQGLQRTEQAVPLLEGVLNGPNSLNVKKRAIYVLALSSDARARDILMRYAKGGGNPDLQLEAVRLLVSRRDQQTTGAVLRELYESTTDTAVRRTIIDAYRTSSRPGPTQGNASPLAATAAQDLAALYQRETDADLRRHIASVLVANGAVDQVVSAIRSERDARTRQRLIGTLNSRNTPRHAQALVDLYGSLTDTESREAVINALAGQQNAEALISLAKAESDVQLKTRIVRQLSEMAPRSKAAADYLMEVIR